MAEKKSFLIRLDAELLEALRRWAGDDLRSLNGQIEYVLRSALNDAGRAPSSNKKRPPGGRQGAN
ncbi:MAG: hypothetical protein IT163_19015 [Bryobacterales bacterium]|nr:hypothetical protein [Bryobacterales bacterium]